VRSFFGFVGRLALQHLLDTLTQHQVRHAEDTVTIRELEKALATERARFEWLSVHVNELKAERAILLDRVLGVQVPVMQIARAVDEPAPAAPRRLTPDDLRNDVAYAPPPVGAPGQVFRRPEASTVTAQMAEAMAAGDLFNDVGDARAKEMGLGWDPEGNLAVDLVPALSGR
jgi:hypothetical protein